MMFKNITLLQKTLSSTVTLGCVKALNAAREMSTKPLFGLTHMDGSLSFNRCFCDIFDTFEVEFKLTPYLLTLNLQSVL